MDDQNNNPASPPLNPLPDQGQANVSTTPPPSVDPVAPTPLPSTDVGPINSSVPDISFPSEDSGPLPLTNEAPPPSADGTASPISQEPPMIPPSKPKLSLGKGKIVATILGILLLVGGVGAGIVLVQQQQDIREKAGAPSSTCTCDSTGKVTKNCTGGTVATCKKEPVPGNMYTYYSCSCEQPKAVPPPPAPTPVQPTPSLPTCGSGACSSSSITGATKCSQGGVQKYCCSAGQTIVDGACSGGSGTTACNCYYNDISKVCVNGSKCVSGGCYASSGQNGHMAACTNTKSCECNPGTQGSCGLNGGTSYRKCATGGCTASGSSTGLWVSCNPTSTCTTPGATQNCGTCGKQTCTNGIWTPCTGDAKANGATCTGPSDCCTKICDCRSGPCKCSSDTSGKGGGQSQDEICNNGKDDDGDGKIDCSDSECSTVPACTPSKAPTYDCSNTKCGDTSCTTGKVVTSNTCFVNHYWCKTRSPGGCTGPDLRIERAVPSASFSKDCGTEQIDLYCEECGLKTVQLTPTRTYASKTYASDCGGGGTESSAQCTGIKVYDTDWNLLIPAQLSVLTAGDTIRLAVSGIASTGTIDKAQFTVNGVALPETTTKKPSSEEFYSEYVIPTGVTSFTVSAKVHHSTLGWF